MPRSSGQKAMPRRAMAFEGSRIVSLPPNLIEPWRRPTMPMTDFSVVVLPAPLRPSSVTTSPSRTSKSMPCRMCDSPYQAFNPRTSSKLDMPGSEIRLDDTRILGHAAVVALGKDLAALQDSDPVGERGNHREVVLDHEHGAIGRHALHQRRDALDVAVRHAGGRLIEQHHLRVERERGGDLKRALAAVGQLDRHGVFELGEADGVN